MKSSPTSICVYLLVCLSVFALVACGNRRKEISPTVQRITESVYASGIVKSISQYNVYSTVVGRIDSIVAAEGKLVRSGDILVTIKRESAILNVRNSDLTARRLDIKHNQSKIEAARDAVALAHSRMENDSILWIRQQNLWKQNVGTRVDVEQRALAFNSSSISYRQALLSLQDLVRDLKYSSDQSKTQLDISKTLASDFVIRASVDGKVFRQYKEKGELVSTGSPIAVVGDADHFMVELNVDELDISRIKSGQRVFVTFDSFKGKVFEATIFSISPMMDEQSRSFIAKASFPTTPPNLYPNLTVEANIMIQSKDSALTIPREFLATDSTVQLSSGELRHVKIGLNDYNWVEITEGIKKQDKLLIPKK